MKNQGILKILLIEDDEDDVELLKEALNDNNVDYSMHVIMEGDKVLPHLKKSSSLPDIIVMDLNLPRFHGKEILKELKLINDFKDVPILVFSTSSAKEDMEYSYKLGANQFITKPATIIGWNETIQAIQRLAEEGKVIR